MAELPDNGLSPRVADIRIAELAARQWGVLSVDELRACGLSHDAIATRVRAGRLHLLYRRVYAVGVPILTLRAVSLPR